jgi:hypothetical protein
MRMMNEFEADELSVLETQIAELISDGNGGRIAGPKRQMQRHEQSWQWARGFLAATTVCLRSLK